MCHNIFGACFPVVAFIDDDDEDDDVLPFLFKNDIR
jgi:hypothetical protein